MTDVIIPNVPGIVPYVASEVDDLEASMAQVRDGTLSPEAFQAYRLVRGVYGQRQPDRQMVRIKVPLGYLTAEQLRVLGRVMRDFAPLKKGHVTTRENVQLHHIPLDATPGLLRLLGSVGLTTREACGNTVRNVTGCPMAGTCPDEAFDATPYGAAYARHFVRREFTRMPRKFKTAFVGCREDHALVRMHDLGFAGIVRDLNGQTVRGFRIVVGGGTSIEPVVAQVLSDFVTAEDGAYLRWAEAVLRVFDRSDELRKNRMRARIKVLVKRVGIDAFRAMVERELEQPWARTPIDMGPLLAILPDEPPDGLVPLVRHTSFSNGGAEFAAWRRTNAVAQKQLGFYGAFVTLPAGDITADQCEGLAAVAERWGVGRVRCTFDQNLVVRWVPEAALYPLWSGLRAIRLAVPGARYITDVVSCPGTDSCKLGITSSMGLNRAVQEALRGEPGLTGDPLVERMRIKISGCPNGCGQHHVADLGFHGAAVKGDQRMLVPSYEIFIAGAYEGTDVRYGARLKGKIPAKAVPKAVIALLRFYQASHAPGEPFPTFAARVGKEAFEAILTPFMGIIPFDAATPGPYQDWERTTLYRLERGEGECSV